MPKRAISKKRAVEAEEEIDMENKEATPVEDVEMILPPVEPTKPMSQEEQPEKSTTKEDTILDKVMEMFLQISQKMDCTKEELSKERKEDNQSLKEELGELSKEMKENNKSTKDELGELSKKMDETTNPQKKN